MRLRTRNCACGSASTRSASGSAEADRAQRLKPRVHQSSCSSSRGHAVACLAKGVAGLGEHALGGLGLGLRVLERLLRGLQRVLRVADPARRVVGVLLGAGQHALAHTQRAARVPQLLLERLAGLASRHARARPARRPRAPWPRARRPARPWSSSWPPRASSSRPAWPWAWAWRRLRGGLERERPGAAGLRLAGQAALGQRLAERLVAGHRVQRRAQAVGHRPRERLAPGLVVRGGVHHGVDGLALGERGVAQAAPAAARERGLLGLAHGVAGLEQRLDQLGLLARDLVGRPGRGGRLGQLGDDRRRLAVAGLADLLGGGVARRGELLEREAVERVDVSHRSRSRSGRPRRASRAASRGS